MSSAVKKARQYYREYIEKQKNIKEKQQREVYLYRMKQAKQKHEESESQRAQHHATPQEIAQRKQQSLQEIKEGNLLSETEVYCDAYQIRWFECYHCKQILSEDQMSRYISSASINIFNRCKQCTRYGTSAKERK